MVQDGLTVKVHYKGTLDDGSVFDSSEGREPLAFELGGGQVIPGFESAVREMDVGETKNVKIESQDAYGAVREEMIVVIPREQFPDQIDPKEGMTLQMRTEQGAIPIRVVEIQDAGVKVDANHPLAGQDLNFELTLVEAG